MTTPYVAHPGSRGDASSAAADAAAPDQVHVDAKNAELEAQSVSMGPVPVRVDIPEGAVYRTMALNGGGVRQLMPQDPWRERALVLAIDEDVILCATKELAQDAANQVSSVPYPTGFYLSKGIPLPLRNKSLVWVANSSSGTATRVSVVVERNENPATV